MIILRGLGGETTRGIVYYDYADKAFNKRMNGRKILIRNLLNIKILKLIQIVIIFFFWKTV